MTIVLSLLTTACMALPATGDDQPTAPKPSDVLANRELLRRRSQYVLPGESELSQGLRSLATLQRKLSRAEKAEAEHQAEIRRGRERIERLTLARRAQNRKLSLAGSIRRQNRLIAKINEITDTLNLLIAFVDNDRSRAQLRLKAGAAREAYFAELTRLRNLLDKTQEEYAELAEDPAVTAALTALTESDGKSYTLGPGASFASNTTKLETHERTVVSASITMRPVGNVHQVDVSINGAPPTPMVFDTGASLVSIPAELAARLNLDPPADAPTIRMSIADGRVIEAKRMTLTSVRVGTFEAENVECAILPPSLTGAPALLGGSFLSNFLYVVDPKSGTLKLSRVDLTRRTRNRSKPSD